MLVRPGVALARQGIGIDWSLLLPDWAVLEVDSDEINPYRRYTAARSNGLPKWWIAQGESDHQFEQFVEAWLDEWIGYVAETIFSLNALIINETKVVFAQQDKRVFDFLEKHGIEPIVSAYRHHYFWDNGIHCSTLDLHREGNIFDLFPQRHDAIIM